MKKDERYVDWFLENPRIAEDLDSYAFDVGEMAWKYQKKKTDELVELVNFKENQIVTINHNTGIRIRNLETKLHKADSIWQAQEKEIQDLEAKLLQQKNVSKENQESSLRLLGKYKQLQGKLAKAVEKNRYLEICRNHYARVNGSSSEVAIKTGKKIAQLDEKGEEE